MSEKKPPHSNENKTKYIEELHVACRMIVNELVKKFQDGDSFPIQTNYTGIDSEDISKLDLNDQISIFEHYSAIAKELGAVLFLKRFNLNLELIEKEDEDEELTSENKYRLAAMKSFPPNILNNVLSELEILIKDIRSTNDGIIALLDPKKLKEQFDGYILEAGAKLFEKRFLEEFAKIKIEK